MTRRTTLITGAAAAVVVALAISCGGGSSSGTAPSPNVTCSNLPNATTILILNNAVCPQSLTVPRGTRVTFFNNDSRAHEMNSDPHPEHTDCPEINQVGFLSPGQSRETGNFVAARTCGFHDHDNPATATLQGTITIK